MQPIEKPIRAVRKPEVVERTGLSGTTIWRLQRKGKFPPFFKLSDNAKGLLECDLERWIAERAAR